MIRNSFDGIFNPDNYIPAIIILISSKLVQWGIRKLGAKKFLQILGNGLFGICGIVALGVGWLAISNWSSSFTIFQFIEFILMDPIKGGTLVGFVGFLITLGPYSIYTATTGLKEIIQKNNSISK